MAFIDKYPNITIFHGWYVPLIVNVSITTSKKNCIARFYQMCILLLLLL